MTTPEKKKTFPPIATAAQIQALFQRAREAIDAVYDRDEDELDELTEDEERERRREEDVLINAAREALRFCCVAAGALGDTSLLGLCAEALRLQDDFDDYAYPHPYMMAEGIRHLLRAGATVDEDVKELAQHRDAHVREAIAGGLRPRGERAIALLEALASDGVAEVRKVAKANLAAVREVPWWQGKLRSDPVARLDPEQALALKPTFEQLSALLDLPRYELRKREEDLAPLVDALPDPLVVDLVETLHSSSERYDLRFLKLLTRMLACPGGVEAFTRLCGVWNGEGGYVTGRQIVEAVTALPLPERRRVCHVLAAWAAARPASARRKQTGDAARLVAEVAGAAWPPGEDLAPILDRLLELEPTPAGELDWVAHGLAAAFESPEVNPTSIEDRLLEARLAGYPGAWAGIRWAVDKVIARLSGPGLRLAAEQAVLSDDHELRSWGVSRLLGPAYDATRDGPLPELAVRFLADPRTRRAMFRDPALTQRAMGPVRAALRAGELAFTDAAYTMRAIHALWGGLPDRHDFLLPHTDPEQRRAAAREAIADFLPPPELSGPPTEEEWAALRAARARFLAGEPLPPEDAELEKHRRAHGPAAALGPFPPGPWDAEDRAVLEAALAQMRAGDADAAVYISSALASKAQPEDLPLFDELLARAPKHGRGLIKIHRKSMREALGLSGPEAAAPGAGEGEEDDREEQEEQEEWMDEEDE